MHREYLNPWELQRARFYPPQKTLNSCFWLNNMVRHICRRQSFDGIATYRLNQSRGRCSENVAFWKGLKAWRILQRKCRGSAVLLKYYLLFWQTFFFWKNKLFCLKTTNFEGKKFLFFFVINVTSVATITNVFTVSTVTTVADATTVTTFTSVGR